MSAHNPFAKPWKAPKPRKDREYGDGRVFKADKTELRREVFERSGGRCEESLIGNNKCGNSITLESMELSHNKHGQGFRDDSLGGTIASCRDCHRNGKHGSKCTYRRRPGKVMTAAKAKEYWLGTVCFCDSDKLSKASFCCPCFLKLSGQLCDDLSRLDGKEWLEALAAAEVELMRAGLEAKQ